MKILLYLSLSLISTGLFGQDIKKHLFDPDEILKQKSELGLTTQQEADIRNLMAGSMQVFNASDQELKSAVDQLNELLAKAQVDKTKAMSQLQKVIALEGKMKETKLDMLIGVKNILTDEQQTELRSSENVTLSVRKKDGESTGEFSLYAHSKNAEPLYILKVNDVERMVKSVEDIDPNDIKAITVFKGEKAIETYGRAGKNGVILIELKN